MNRCKKRSREVELRTTSNTVFSELAPAPAPSGGNGPHWLVTIKVQRTSWGFRWNGLAADAEEATAKAMDAARRAWPGFSIVVRSVVEVA